MRILKPPFLVALGQPCGDSEERSVMRILKLVVRRAGDDRIDDSEERSVMRILKRRDAGLGRSAG